MSDPAMRPLRELVEAHRDEIKDIVARHHGRSVAIFGSVARGDEQPGSDIDFLVELEPDARPIEILSIGVELEEVLGVKVDVGTAAALKERLRDEVLAEATPLDTPEPTLAEAGHRLTATPVLRWQDVEIRNRRTAAVPDRLPNLPAIEAVRSLGMPLHLDWSRPGRVVDLADRSQRARAYEVALREGRPGDIESIVDGALLVDLWTDLTLPRELRKAWQPIIDEAVGREVRWPRAPSPVLDE